MSIRAVVQQWRSARGALRDSGRGTWIGHARGGYRYVLSTPGRSGHFELRPYPRIARTWTEHTSPSGFDWTTARFKLRPRSYRDDNGTHYDVVIIQGIQVDPLMQRRGVATGMVEMICNHYPGALIAGECPSVDARAWHEHLNKIAPSRMIGLDSNHRIRPGAQPRPWGFERQ